MRRVLLFILTFCLMTACTANAEFVLIDRTQDIPEAVSSANTESWPKTITVTFGGDCTIGCTDNQRSDASGFSHIVSEMGYSWPFSGIADVLSEDDMTLVNFEGTFTESTDKVKKKFNFKGPAEYAQILLQGSVEAVNLANNHSGDYGTSGKQDTIDTLNEFGITWCAMGQTGIYEVRGVKIGLIGHTFPYTNGKCDISKEIKALREAGCQIVIASFHWGSEYEKNFTRDQRTIGRAAIDSGADIVVGHHPHIIQGIEAYEDSYILYSLGNLVFGGNMDPSDRDTYLARVTFTVYEDGTVDAPELKIIPARITSCGEGTDYRPVIAQEDTASRILDRILERSYNMKNFINPN